MITLNPPVTIAIRTVTFSNLTWTLLDDGRKACALIDGCIKELTLWDGTTTPTYEAIGDYTQAQIESRISELLKNNPAQILSALCFIEN